MMNDVTSNMNIVITLDNMLFLRFRASTNILIIPLSHTYNIGSLVKYREKRQHCLILLKKIYQKLVSLN